MNTTLLNTAPLICYYSSALLFLALLDLV